MSTSWNSAGAVIPLLVQWEYNWHFNVYWTFDGYAAVKGLKASAWAQLFTKRQGFCLTTHYQDLVNCTSFFPVRVSTFILSKGNEDLPLSVKLNRCWKVGSTRAFRTASIHLEFLWPEENTFKEHRVENIKAIISFLVATGNHSYRLHFLLKALALSTNTSYNSLAPSACYQK